MNPTDKEPLLKVLDRAEYELGKCHIVATYAFLTEDLRNIFSALRERLEQEKK